MIGRLPLLLIFFACASFAHAQSAPLVPSYTEARQRADERSAARLEQTLRALPGVVTARVHIARADGSRIPLDQPLPKVRIAAWLELRGPGPSDQSVRALLSAATPDATPESIQIVRQTRPQNVKQATQLASVGPFRVTRDSAPWLRGLLAVLLATNACLCIVVLTRRRGQAGM